MTKLNGIKLNSIIINSFTINSYNRNEKSNNPNSKAPIGFEELIVNEGVFTVKNDNFYIKIQ